MHDSLTTGPGLEAALDPGGQGGEGSEVLAPPTELPNGDALALAAGHLRLVQLGHSGPLWLGVALWDAIFAAGKLAGAWNGIVCVPHEQPVRAVATFLEASAHAAPRSPLRVSHGVGLWDGRT